MRSTSSMALTWLLAGSAAAATFHVAPNGNNANPGTRDRPWASPAYGARQLAPGDTLVILPGRYVLADFENDVLRPSSGTPGAWVTILGEGTPPPVLVGRDNLLTAVDLAGVEYVRLANLEITHDNTVQGEAAFFRDGLEVLGSPSAHLVLENLHIHHIDEYGMNLQDIEDVSILNCRIEYCGFGSLGGPAGEHGGWRNVTIRGCSLSWAGHYYQGGDGSGCPYDRPDGFGIEPSQGPILIEETRAEHNRGDGLDSKAANTVIRRSIVASNSCDGIKVWGEGSRIENSLVYGRGDGDSTATPWAPLVIDQVERAGARFEVVNVTVDDVVGQNYLMYVQYGLDTPVEVTLRNVIFSGRGRDCPIYVNGASRLIVDHVLFHLPQSAFLLTYGEQAFTCDGVATLGTGARCGDPLFVSPVNAGEGDYRLRPGSPAIDTGTAVGAPALDLLGLPRDSRPDLGAYEWRPSPSGRLRRHLQRNIAPRPQAGADEERDENVGGWVGPTAKERSKP